MKAISLWQPWASLIACGVKRYETRHWAPSRDLIGQTIAIHAAKKIDRESGDFVDALNYGQFRDAGAAMTGFALADALRGSWGDCPDEMMGLFGQASIMPIGCVVATAKLDAAFELGELTDGTMAPAALVTRRFTSRSMPPCFTVRIDPFGNFAPGRWAWLLSDIRPLKPPIAMKGAQGFFRLPEGWLTSGEAAE